MKGYIIVAAVLLMLPSVVGVAAADAPMADAGLDQTVSVETTVYLDGTGSTHPDGDITAHEWTIRTPDGRTISPHCPTCARTQFPPTAPGRYEVTVEVIAADGQTATDTLYVYVNDAGPEVTLSGKRTPAPSEPVEFTATAESSDAELSEIAWAIEDEIIATRPLDGTSDESTLEFAFTEIRTHRVQVVVKDANGRTAYDQVLVQPREDDADETSLNWSDTDPIAPEPGCADLDYLTANPGECMDAEPRTSPPTVTPTPTPEPSNPSDEGNRDEFALFETDGYVDRFNLGSRIKNSAYIGETVSSLGIDGGENAPWKTSVSEQLYEDTVGTVSKALFGQERKTVSCEVAGGEINACDETIRQLENEGRTMNVRSPQEGGAYSAYGLAGAERTTGTDLTHLEDGQRGEATIVIQQDREGLINKTVKTTKETTKDSIEKVRDITSQEEQQEADSGDSDSGPARTGEPSQPTEPLTHHETSDSASDSESTSDRSSVSDNDISLDISGSLSGGLASGDEHRDTTSTDESTSSVPEISIGSTDTGGLVA